MQKRWLLLFFLMLSKLLWCQPDPIWSHATLSAYAIDMRTGKVIMDLESDKSMIPASCLKIVTTGAALHILGPESRFQTDLEIEGEVKEGVLQGNLIIRGGGDPCLGSDRIAPSKPWNQQIEEWANAIAKRGIKAIQGQVIGDASKWEKAQAVPSWTWEDLGNYYGAGACALSFHENTYSIYFSPGSQEGDATVLKRVVPALPSVSLKNEVKTGPVGSGDRACIYGSEFSMTRYIRGTIPARAQEFMIKGSIPDPAQLCTELILDALEKKGIRMEGQQNLSLPQKTIIHTTVSPTIHEIVYWTNQQSINLYAEHLLKSMGEKVFQEGTTSSGTKAVVEFWKSQGMDIRGMNIADGSGLSRKNFMTAKQLVFVLEKMKQSPYFSYFHQSLPEIRKGIRAKSGSVSFVRGYAGYKGDIAFALLINHCSDVQEMKQKLDQILTELSLKGDY